MAHLKDLLVAGPSRFIGETAFNDSITLNETLYITKNTDISTVNPDNPALVIGSPPDDLFLEIDRDEIQAKKKGAVNGLGLNLLGGLVTIGSGGLITTGTITVGDGTASSSATTGELIVKGGIGVSKASYFDAAVTVNGATTLKSTLTVTGAITGNSTLTVSGVAQTGNTLTIYNSSGGDAVLYFNRSTSAGWKIRDSSAVLYFSTDWDPVTNKKNENGTFVDKVNFDISGNITAVGRISSKGITSNTDVSPSSNAGSGMTLGTSSKYWRTLYVGDGTDSSSTTTGAALIKGGLGVTGQVNAKTIRVDNSVYFQYNSTDKCLDVIFG